MGLLLALAPLSIGLALAAAQPVQQEPVAPAPRSLEGGLDGSRGLVVLLHGGSWSPRASEELARSTLYELSPEARRVGLRLLAPILPAGVMAWGEQAERRRDAGEEPTVPWASPEGERLVLRLIAAEVEENRTDPARVYLAGHGAGATAALLLAARHPERIAAVAAWSGAPAPLWDEERRVVALLEDPVARLAGVPVYLWTGVDDSVLDRDALARFVTEMQERMRSDGRWVLAWEQGEGGHGFGRNGPRRGLRFLKGHRKAGRR